MEHLWAPWRMSYVGAEQPEGCIFCVKSASDDDEHNHLLHRGDAVFIMLNRYPYNTGHLMIAPFRHVADPLQLAPQESSEVLYGIRIAMEVLRGAYHPDGFNIGANIGHCAGAGYAGHMHVHVVPRWSGDTNFMAVSADTRVVPESLDETYRKLKQALAERDQGRAGRRS